MTIIVARQGRRFKAKVAPEIADKMDIALLKNYIIIA